MVLAKSRFVKRQNGSSSADEKKTNKLHWMRALGEDEQRSLRISPEAS
jgi:hypothetical protein